MKYGMLRLPILRTVSIMRSDTIIEKNIVNSGNRNFFMPCCEAFHEIFSETVIMMLA